MASSHFAAPARSAASKQGYFDKENNQLPLLIMLILFQGGHVRMEKKALDGFALPVWVVQSHDGFSLFDTEDNVLKKLKK